MSSDALSVSSADTPASDGQDPFEACWGRSLDLLRLRYQSAAPFPHLVVDDFLPHGLALSLEQACRAATTPVDSSNAFTQAGKLTLNDWTLMPPRLRQACGFFHSGAFIAALEAITGLSGLIADPHLEGGGLHRTAAGGFLKMHTDFSWHARLQLHRRLNVLLYLNSGYQSAWGGELLLSADPSRQRLEEMVSIEPRFNRLVVFATGDTTFHGHPRPHAFPAGFPRTSLAFYYYSAASWPWRLRRRLPASTTRFVPAQGERIELQSVPWRRRLGYWIRRWTPLP